MPYQVGLDAGLMRIVLSDVLTVDDLHQVADEIEQIENASPVTPNRLVDILELSEAILDFSALYAVAQRRRAILPKNPIRTALVATSPVAVGYARMFQTLMTHPEITVRLFERLEDAERWLKERNQDPIASESL
jgi:citrate lyase beta subunit